MGEGLLQIVISAVLIFVALKIAKNIAKTAFIAVIVIAGFLLVKGVIDWAMIESVGYSIFEWIKSKISGEQIQTTTALMLNRL